MSVNYYASNIFNAISFMMAITVLAADTYFSVKLIHEMLGNKRHMALQAAHTYPPFVALYWQKHPISIGSVING